MSNLKEMEGVSKVKDWLLNSSGPISHQKLLGRHESKAQEVPQVDLSAKDDRGHEDDVGAESLSGFLQEAPYLHA
jgi:hypothetical protein